MAKGRDDTPSTAPPAPKPQGGTDFKSLVNDALSQIVTTGPEGQQVQGAASSLAPPVSAPAPVQQPTQHVPRPQMVSPPEDHSIASYRDMLRQEEERISQRQPRPEIPLPPAMSQLYGVPQGAMIEGGKVKYKAGASPLLVECYEVLSRAVAGGMIAPYGTFYRDVQRLVQDLGTEVVDVIPVTVPDVKVPI